jgi:predicted nucleotidyltransferase
MAVAGIVCEYNPFHLGHARQLRQVRERLGGDAGIVCLMSGNFVQRGEPAIFDRTVRAAAAVDCGASLVLELPVTCALRSAEGFASGAAELFTRLGGTDFLAFGCECGDGAAVERTAALLGTAEFSAALQGGLSRGLSYPAARQAALEAAGGDGRLLRNPNDILAAEYARALQTLGSPIRPLGLPRQGDYHDETADPENPSATAVRALLLTGGWEPFVPPEARRHYEGAAAHTAACGERAMLARLRALSREDWERAAHGSEGLWSKVWKAVQRENSVEAVLAASKSKRYPRTRLQRLLTCAFLGLDAGTLAARPPYVRALAFDGRGRALLRGMRERGGVSVVNAGERPADEAFYSLERRCAGLWGLFSSGEPESAAELVENARVYCKTL